MSSKYTPGPWHVSVCPGPIVYGEQGEQVASLFVPMVPVEENNANARLIAAAPDLLAALERLTRLASHPFITVREPSMEDMPAWHEAKSAARSAIAKARETEGN